MSQNQPTKLFLYIMETKILYELEKIRLSIGKNLANLGLN